MYTEKREGGREGGREGERERGGETDTTQLPGSPGVTLYKACMCMYK